MVGPNYRVGKKLGSGNFGELHYGSSVRSCVMMIMYRQEHRHRGGHCHQAGVG
jgi:hypothetical protein